MLKTKKTQNIKNRLIKSINTYVDISTHPLISGGDMVGAYSVFTDVTKENRLNKEIKKMTAVAEEYNQQIQARKFLEENKIIGESKIYLDCVNKSSESSQYRYHGTASGERTAREKKSS